MPGPQSEDPVFRTIYEPPSYANSTDGPIRYTPVYVDNRPVAYLWAAADGSAAGVRPRGQAGFNAAAGWTARLVQAYADGIAPLDILRHWAGRPVDPAEQRCGVVRAGEEQEGAGLAPLDVLAGQKPDASTQRRGGPQSENPHFETVVKQPMYAETTDGPVRFTTVYVEDRPVAYLWAAADGSAASVLPRGRSGSNAAAGWYRRLRDAYAQGMPPLATLRHWAGRPIAPAEQRCGVVRAGEEREAGSLAELRALISDADT